MTVVGQEGRASREAVLADSSAFDAARAAFDRAAQRAPDDVSILAFTLAGRRVHLHVAGQHLADRLQPAFAHLRIDAPSDGPAPDAVAPQTPAVSTSASASPAASGPAPDLTLRVWDAAATGIDSPYPWLDDPGLNGLVDVSADKRIVAHRRRTSTAWLDRRGHEVVACFPDAQRTALYDRAKPLQLPLAVWHIDRDAPLVHAGVVARNGRGILFPGKGGSGKTTASLSCALAGFDYLGDDCVALERLDTGRSTPPSSASRAIRVHSVYSSTNVAPHHLDRFPALKPYAIPGATADEDKHLVMLHARLPKPLARITTLAAIAIPRIVTGTRDTQLRPASRAETLRALAPSTLLFFPGAQAAHLAFLAAVVAAVPCYWLEMGQDIAQIPGCLDSLVHA